MSAGWPGVPVQEQQGGALRMAQCKATPTSALLLPELAWRSQQAGEQMLPPPAPPCWTAGAAGDPGAWAWSCRDLLLVVQKVQVQEWAAQCLLLLLRTTKTLFCQYLHGANAGRIIRYI